MLKKIKYILSRFRFLFSDLHITSINIKLNQNQINNDATNDENKSKSKIRHLQIMP